MAICHFLKPETNKGDFRLYFVLVEKSCRGRHHSEILKTNTKTLIYSIWIQSQGSLGCQKVRQDPQNTLSQNAWISCIINKRQTNCDDLSLLKRTKQEKRTKMDTISVLSTHPRASTRGKRNFLQNCLPGFMECPLGHFLRFANG